MIESKELLAELKVIRNQLIDLATKLDNLLAKNSYKWNKEEIEIAGWKYSGIYQAGNEYFYEKNKKLVRVSKTYDYILTYDGRPMLQLMDHEELEEYANS